uniref:Uncharacterized protein n=1 Tax=Anguilla anguilla TaxID=7936 RepID=A0A0E9VZV2_ANGAN
MVVGLMLLRNVSGTWHLMVMAGFRFPLPVKTLLSPNLGGPGGRDISQSATICAPDLERNKS